MQRLDLRISRARERAEKKRIKVAAYERDQYRLPSYLTVPARIVDLEVAATRFAKSVDRAQRPLRPEETRTLLRTINLLSDLLP